eukprot:CAMPEP_0170099386 /NCGR_PEP_ID=MMETSP0020_2-20130122/1002_1 /TAXON_ID=98059 /ORGANISM="Dinobryon sp., Strain UTEXLB2267" /LENGTH=46 /DNA_ID= /DNA_START= /DNA_END= /DNA_ORIENTATION=
MYVGYVVRSGLAKSVPSFLLPALASTSFSDGGWVMDVWRMTPGRDL